MNVPTSPHAGALAAPIRWKTKDASFSLTPYHACFLLLLSFYFPLELVLCLALQHRLLRVPQPIASMRCFSSSDCPAATIAHTLPIAATTYLPSGCPEPIPMSRD